MVMKKLNLLLLAFLVVMGVTFQSCDDGDGYSLGDVAVDWATVNVKGAHVYDFTGDRWGQIWPATTDYFWYSPIDGQRVILYFNFGVKILISGKIPGLTSGLIRLKYTACMCSG